MATATDKLRALIQDPESPRPGFEVSERLVRTLSRAEAEAIGDLVLSKLESPEPATEPWEEFLVGGEEGGKALLLHFAALVPGCAERFGEHLGLEDREEGLYLRTCARLVARAEGEGPGAVEAPAPHEGHCAWCGMQLVTLLSVDLTDPQLAFLGLGGQRLRIATCFRCSCYQTVFTDVDLLGASAWREQPKPAFNGREGDTWDATPEVSLCLGPRRATPWEAHSRVTWKGISQIGGYPTWIQEPDYPSCPRCNQPMQFIGQVENGLVWGGEGASYGFFCRACSIAAASYQQS